MLGLCVAREQGRDAGQSTGRPGGHGGGVASGAWLRAGRGVLRCRSEAASNGARGRVGGGALGGRGPAAAVAFPDGLQTDRRVTRAEGSAVSLRRERATPGLLAARSKNQSEQVRKGARRGRPQLQKRS